MFVTVLRHAIVYIAAWVRLLQLPVLYPSTHVARLFATGQIEVSSDWAQPAIYKNVQRSPCHVKSPPTWVDSDRASTRNTQTVNACCKEIRIEPCTRSLLLPVLILCGA